MDKIYKELVNMRGVPSFERGIRKYVESEIKDYCDEIIYDNLGGVFGVKKSKKEDAPVVMVAGHMDEVGAMIVDVTKEGLLKIVSMGGITPEVMLSQHMEIVIDNGDIVPGIISTVAPHLLRGTTGAPAKMKFDDLLLDIGADDKEHVAKLGVKVGQQVTFQNQYTVTADGKKIISKAWDNRWGVGMAIELLKDLKDVELDVTIVAGATVQEEVGLRGAIVASQMVKPDIFIACDVSPANDFGMAKDTLWGTLGKGTLLRFHDPRCVMHRGLREFYIETAEENKINYQWFKSMGGTDAAAAQYAGHGAIVTTVGLCARYIHTNTSMLHKDDHESAKQILRAIVKKLNKEELAKIRKNV